MMLAVALASLAACQVDVSHVRARIAGREGGSIVQECTIMFARAILSDQQVFHILTMCGGTHPYDAIHTPHKPMRSACVHSVYTSVWICFCICIVGPKDIQQQA